jgi:hypothetical protein
LVRPDVACTREETTTVYQLPCSSCLLRLEDPPTGVNPLGWVDYPTLTKHDRHYPVYNPQQRYLCPECGYCWTNRPGYRWETFALTTAGIALMISVALIMIETKQNAWISLIVMIVTYGAIRLTEELRSAVEDWFDPAEHTDRPE